MKPRNGDSHKTTQYIRQKIPLLIIYTYDHNIADFSNSTK